MTTMTIYLKDKDRERIAKYADELGMNVSTFVRYVLLKKLKEDQR